MDLSFAVSDIIGDMSQTQTFVEQLCK